MVAFIKEMQAEIGKPKFTFESMEIDHDLFEAIKDELHRGRPCSHGYR